MTNNPFSIPTVEGNVAMQPQVSNIPYGNPAILNLLSQMSASPAQAPMNPFNNRLQQIIPFISSKMLPAKSNIDSASFTASRYFQSILEQQKKLLEILEGQTKLNNQLLSQNWKLKQIGNIDRESSNPDERLISIIVELPNH